MQTRHWWYVITLASGRRIGGKTTARTPAELWVALEAAAGPWASWALVQLEQVRLG